MPIGEQNISQHFNRAEQDLAPFEADALDHEAYLAAMTGQSYHTAAETPVVQNVAPVIQLRRPEEVERFGVALADDLTTMRTRGMHHAA